MNAKPSRPLWFNPWLKLSYGVLIGMMLVLILGIVSL